MQATTAPVSCSPAPPGRQREHTPQRDRSPGSGKSPESPAVGDEAAVGGPRGVAVERAGGAGTGGGPTAPRGCVARALRPKETRPAPPVDTVDRGAGDDRRRTADRARPRGRAR